MEGEKAKAAAVSIATYGEALFEQLFADRRAYGAYRNALAGGIANLKFEILSSSPEFHAIHWEALRDPELKRALACEASMVRKTIKVAPLPAVVRTSPTLNLLVVVARPNVETDVDYRTISRPLVDALRQTDLQATRRIDKNWALHKRGRQCLPPTQLLRPVNM